MTLVFEIIESYCDVFVLFVYRLQLNIENKITIKMKQVFSPKKVIVYERNMEK